MDPWPLLLFASLLPWQLRPMLMLTPTTPTATATATTLATTTTMDSPTDTATDTATSDTPMPLDTTMARGLLMPRLLLKLMPMPTTTMGMLTTAMVSTMATLLPT